MCVPLRDLWTEQAYQVLRNVFRYLCIYYDEWMEKRPLLSGLFRQDLSLSCVERRAVFGTAPQKLSGKIRKYA